MRSGMVFLGVSILLGPLVGCSQPTEKPPTTHKVEGKVVYQNGKAFTTGGAIEFRHETKEGPTSRGTIKPDGTFELYTMTADSKVPGAQEGPHLVTIFPTSADRTAPPITLTKTYGIAAGANRLTVHIEE